MRVGLGFDAHAFDEERPLFLAGVEFEGPGLSGHSDADVVSHALADALLGAAGMGDIGDLFPANEYTDNARSISFVAEVGRLLAEAGWTVANVDVTVIAQAVRIAPRREEMRDQIAAALRLDRNLVSVKATSTDTMGFTGRGEGMAATAVALIDRLGD